MKNIPNILKAMFALFFVLQILVYHNLYAANVDVTKLDLYMDKLEANNENVFSLSVTEKGNPVYLRSIGFVDRTFTTHSNINTCFRIGELSKTFTSIVIMQMVDEKMIQFGTPVSRFFPEIPNGRHITVKDLMTHRVNIMHYLPGGKFYKAIKSEFVFEELLNEDPVQPNEFEFSDPNFLILGLIIEKITGQDYHDVVKQRISDRIGLKYTVGIKNENIQQIPGKWDLNSLKGSGSIISSPGDLGKLMHALFNEKLVSNKSLKLLFNSNDATQAGLKEFSISGKTGFGFSGTMDDYTTQSFYFPSDSVCISFSYNNLSNVNMNDLMRIIYGS